jgi:hypothetical protein
VKEMEAGGKDEHTAKYAIFELKTNSVTCTAS